MTEEVLDVKKNNADKIEQWCRKTAYLIVQPGTTTSVALQKVWLSEIPHKKLHHLTRYLRRCENRRARGLLNDYEYTDLFSESFRLIQKANSLEVALKPPNEFEHFLSPTKMQKLVGGVENLSTKEAVALISQEARRLLKLPCIEIKEREPDEESPISRIFSSEKNADSIYNGKDVVALVHGPSKLVCRMTPHLAPYFREFLGKLQHLPKDSDWISVSGMNTEIRGRDGKNLKAEIANLRSFIEGLLEDNTNIALQAGETVRASEYIGYFGRGKLNARTLMISPTAQKFVKLNYCEALSKLEDKEQYVTSTKICKSIGVSYTPENRSIVQLLLKNAKDTRRHELIELEVEGEVKTMQVGEVCRKLASGGIPPAFFIHKSALEEPFISSEQAIVTKQMVVDRRNELRASKTNPSDLLEQPTARVR